MYEEEWIGCSSKFTRLYVSAAAFTAFRRVRSSAAAFHRVCSRSSSAGSVRVPPSPPVQIASFTWALKSFLYFVKDKWPQTILTDQDLALKEAISMELPNTKHAFCIWHIVAKLPTWFSFLLGERFNEFKSEFFRLYNLECASDFEQQWKSMVDKFHLSTDTHIVLLYSHRQCWALAYLKDFFFAGMTTTGRSESINSYIKRFLDAKKSLVDFVNQVGIAVNIRNQVGEEARMRQKYHNPALRTNFLIEEHAATILTPYAFELLQHEIELSTKYAATESGNDTYIVRHHTQINGGRFVSWIKEEESIHCSCKEFEFSGILCRHAIRVLLNNDCFSLPTKYLPSRWRRESSLIPKSSHLINSSDNLSIEFRSLVRYVEAESLKTKDRVEIATIELKKIIELVKRMPEIQEHTIDIEHDVPNGDDCDVENPIVSKTKGRPRGSRAKGGVEAAKKSRRCHFPNCGGINHDSRNCPNKKKKTQALPFQSPDKYGQLVCALFNLRLDWLGYINNHVCMIFYDPAEERTRWKQRRKRTARRRNAVEAAAEANSPAEERGGTQRRKQTARRRNAVEREQHSVRTGGARKIVDRVFTDETYGCPRQPFHADNLKVKAMWCDDD
ncbi:hypothetical protein RIF29_16488 [Crotalaria pallida]|uniref:Protein FAR1-RELATED SEQUENCE n=1 Tax=Crotalaria pallida TaxID=3830 RepID=A0AAN9FFG7_CROPI